jgi:alcohol dehydrogenase (cytochrome c)
MQNKTKYLLLAGAAVIGGIFVTNFNIFLSYAGLIIPAIEHIRAPAGEITIEMNPDAQPVQKNLSASTLVDTGKDWTSFNKTLTSNRFSSLSEINTENAEKLKVLCTYDTKEISGFTTGLLEVQGKLIFTSWTDTFAVDPDTCREIWRVKENVKPALPQTVSRGSAYLDNMIFRGTLDCRVIAYALETGKKIWETKICNPKSHESIPAAPIAWNGKVFIGNAGGDFRGVKGRMYALDAKTGKVLWEFFMVPQGPEDKPIAPVGNSPLDNSTWRMEPGAPISGGGTWTTYSLDPEKGLLYIPGGNPAPDFDVEIRQGSNLYTGSVVVLDTETGDYVKHFKIIEKDWHDWDISNAPVIFTSGSGRKQMALSPKDGHLYGFDLSSNKQIYRVPVTKQLNADVPFERGKLTYFCPGAGGGGEWNGPAFDPSTNQLMVGSVEWCMSIKIGSKEETMKTPAFMLWFGQDYTNAANSFGKWDPMEKWAGWLTVTNVETGNWNWRAKTNYPIVAAVTPTAGGLTFFGDLGGNFYALNSLTGKVIWHHDFGGALAAGLITYDAGKGQRVAVAHGLSEVMWPTKITTSKVSIIGFEK